MPADEQDGLPADTPASVRAYAAGPGRTPPGDPALGVHVDVAARGEPPHRLVVVGDSLSHGFQSGAVGATDLSWPAVVAHEMGWTGFRRPEHLGKGGIPLNLEMVLRDLEHRFGSSLSMWETPLALFRLRDLMDEVEDHWERGPGAAPPRATRAFRHALAVYGWDVRDALSRNAAECAAAIGSPQDDVLRQLVEHDGERAALHVYPTWPGTERMTLFDVAEALGADHDGSTDAGIETLVVMLGSNNALRSVSQLRLRWSGPGFADPARKGAYTMWRPEHFSAELAEVVRRVSRIEARHVVWATVPHVTIPPVSRGIGGKVARGSRYFPFYARPWVDERRFDPHRHAHLTAAQARAVDYGIDMMDDAITSVVERGRAAGRDWYLLDLAELLDRLASRRYLEDPSARPAWWTPYPLPAELAALDPPPDSRFLAGDGHGGRSRGGLFSLDGVHPTTVGYGLIAREVLAIMRSAGVELRFPDGTPRPADASVDFARLVQRDTLATHPPQNLTSTLDLLAWADATAGAFGKALPF